MDKRFSIELCSDFEYEELVADIYFMGHAIGMITQEKGIDNMEIKLFQLIVSSLDVPLNEYLNTINEAVKLLVESRSSKE